MCADKSRLAEWRKLSYYDIEDRASHEIVRARQESCELR